MNLEKHIKWVIYNYPTLYRADTYEESRIFVLGHIFLSYGTGYEWHPDGFLADLYNNYKFNQIMDELPDGYFDKLLYTMGIYAEDVKRVPDGLKNRFHYFVDRMNRTLYCIFEAENKDDARRVIYEYGYKHFELGKANRYKDNDIKIEMESIKKTEDVFSGVFAQEAHATRESRRFHKPYYYVPNNMCKYSPIVEMINGETNSPHIENFKFTHFDPEWLQGAIDIVEYSLLFYEDPEKCELDSYHPVNRGYDKDITEEKKWEFWKTYKIEQMEKLTKFLTIFKN